MHWRTVAIVAECGAAVILARPRWEAFGLTATTLHVVVATLIGGTAGFVGGKFDLVVQRVVPGDGGATE